MLAVIGLLCSISVSAHDFEVDGIYYTITSSADKTVGVTFHGDDYESYFNEYPGAVTIPESVTYNGSDYSVTSIEDYAFYYCPSLLSVVIPNSVTSIGDYAFLDCYKLTSVVIPNSVTSIGEWAFADCSRLTSVVISNSVTSIEDYAFYNCYNLTSVVIPNSVTSIGNSAFSGCSNLTSVEIPNSVTSIGDYAFLDCYNLTSVVIPNSVTSIGDEAFRRCSGLTSLVVASENPVYDSREGCNAIIHTSSNELVAGCQSTIIPNSVTSIGEYAFYICSGLTSVVIPNSVTSIGDYAFYNCSKLRKLISHAEVPPSCGSSVFEGVNKKACVLQVPGDCIPAYQQADQWKEFFFIEGVPTAIGGVTMDGAASAKADVYSTNGMLIKRNAELKNLKHELPAGIYIIGGKKVWVK